MGVETYPLILLAGGRASRMGSPKGLKPFNGRPWLEAQIDAFMECGGSRTVVVLGHQREEYVKALPWCGTAVSGWTGRGRGEIGVAVNPNPDLGQFSSILTGVSFLLKENPGAKGAFLLPVDVPCPSREVWVALAAALTGEVEGAVPVFEGKGGHPVLLSRELLRRIERIAPASVEARLDAQLHALPPGKIARTEVADARVCANINTPEDWERFAQ